MTARFQLSRRKGWRMPPGGLSVARPSRWANPYKIQPHGPFTRAESILLFADDLAAGRIPDPAPLRGHPLGCWCRLDESCHADVLLQAANQPRCEECQP